MFTVKGDDVIVTVDKKSKKAAWEYDWNGISIFPKAIADGEIRETIIHELFHAILDKYYYANTSNPLLTKKQEEQLVNILSNELDRNRDIIDKLSKTLNK